MKVSVFSCWHNRKFELEQSVRSILDQEGVDFEFVIVDDASDDGTSELLAAIAHPRLRIIRNETNIGFTRSAIRAVAACRGHYVAVHGAGDVSLPGRLAKLADFLDGNGDAVAVGSLIRNYDLTTGRKAPFDPRKGDEEGLAMKYLHAEVMFRRDIYERVGGYRSIFYYTQDKDLWYRMQVHGRLACLDETLYERRIFADGVQGDTVKLIRQAVFSSLMIHAVRERKAGRPDPVERFHALSLLMQPPSARLTKRARMFLPRLLRKLRFADARNALETVPAGMLSWRMLLLLLFLRILAPRRQAAP
jgi:glycosyltransferase involved in cell wall biosynthesis